MRAIKVYCPPGVEPPLYAFIDALDGKLKATIDINGANFLSIIEEVRIVVEYCFFSADYEKPTELTFGNPTVITGGNGRGKTSIADAIAFAVTGLPLFGERGLDRLHNEKNPDVAIQMRFVDENGITHELTRIRRNNDSNRTAGEGQQTKGRGNAGSRTTKISAC